MWIGRILTLCTWWWGKDAYMIPKGTTKNNIKRYAKKPIKTLKMEY